MDQGSELDTLRHQANVDADMLGGFWACRDMRLTPCDTCKLPSLLYLSIWTPPALPPTRSHPLIYDPDLP